MGHALSGAEATVLLVVVVIARCYYCERGVQHMCFQAVDLVAFREVAVKIHQLTPQWSEEKKASYVKHAVRPANPHSLSMHNDRLPRQ